MANQPTSPRGTPASGLARLEVVLSHDKLAFFHDAVTPSVHLDGVVYPASWGEHIFEVTPGRHEVGGSYPWLLSPHCGKNTLKVDLRPGQSARVRYHASVIRYIPGKVTLE